MPYLLYTIQLLFWIINSVRASSIIHIHTGTEYFPNIYFKNEIRDITLLPAVKHRETLRSKAFTNFEYLVGDSYNVIFQCKQHN